MQKKKNLKLRFVEDMMVGSKEINKAIKEIIHPVLIEDGYTVIQPRKAWKHLENKIYLFMISAVGSYFSGVTGFPPMSITASINIFYINFPDGKTFQECDKLGRPLPKETECHFRFSLDKNDKQIEYTESIHNPIEKNRSDVWWVDPSGVNIDPVILDLKKTLIEYAFPLVEKPCYAYEEQSSRYKNR